MMGSLKSKLLFTCLLVGLLPLAVSGVLGYRKSAASLLKDNGEQLYVIAQTVMNKIDRNLYERTGDAQMCAYLSAGVSTPEAKSELMTHLMQAYGFYDLVLEADAEGKVVAAKTMHPQGEALAQRLIGRSVRGEEWFERCINNQITPGGSYSGDLIEDRMVAEVTKTRGLALNFSAPVFDASGKAVRVWSNRASWERVVGSITEETRNLGLEHGDHLTVQLVSKDGLLLDDPDPSAVLSFNVARAGLLSAQEIVAGRSGFAIEEHKRTHEMQTNAYAVSKGFGGFPGFKWGILVRQNIEESLSLAHAIRDFSFRVGLVAAALVTVVAVWTAHGIAKPLQEAAEVLRKVADGDLRPRLLVRTRDEVGRMAAALNQALENLTQVMQGIDERAATLAASSTELSTVSRQLSANAEATSSRAEMASAAGEQVSVSVRSVSAATKQMAESIRQVASNSVVAGQIAGEAVEEAEATHAIVGRLGTSSEEIGQVIGVITGIAAQTNLLALNATIEAARAGDVGRGFAVVANEVKELAKRTLDATNEIGTRVNAIQQDSRDMVSALGRIHSTIHRINETQNSIANSVQQQAAVTDEISTSLAEASTGSSEISRSIADVAANATQTGAGAGEVWTSSDHVAKMGSELNRLVAQFKFDIVPAQA